MTARRVAVVGATGAVGTIMLELLERRGFPADEIVLFASERSAGDGDVVRQLALHRLHPSEVPWRVLRERALPAEHRDLRRIAGDAHRLAHR